MSCGLVGANQRSDHSSICCCKHNRKRENISVDSFGYNISNGSISGAYAAGSVNRRRLVGGFFGQNYGSITGAYASGRVGGSSLVGGFGELIVPL